MTNDKDGAALLREAIEQFMREIDRLEAEYGFDRPLHQGQCIMLPLSALLNLRAALKSHGQAFDAAGVREACANVARNFEYKEPTHYFDDPFSAAGEMIAEEILALPIPEAPASGEPVAGGALTCDVKLPPATTVRAGCSFDTLRLAMSLPGRPRHFDDTIGSHFGNGGGFDPVEAQGAWDKGAQALIKEAAALVQPSEGEAVFYIRVGGRHTSMNVKTKGQVDPDTALQNAIAALNGERSALSNCPVHNNPNGFNAAKADWNADIVADLAAIGPRPIGMVLAWRAPRPCFYRNTDIKECGHCHGCRERITREAALATPSPGFGGGDLREALSGIREWIAALTVTDMNELVADGGLTAGMLVGQEAGEQLRRLDAALSHDQRGGAGE